MANRNFGRDDGQGQGRIRGGSPSRFKAVVGGTWEGDHGKRCQCLKCGMNTMDISPGDKGGWAWFCTNRQCPTHPKFPSTFSLKGRRQPVVAAFHKLGISLSSRDKPRRAERPPADMNAVINLKDAEKRVLAYLVSAAGASAKWIERTHRGISGACHVSTRHTTGILKRLEEAKVIGVRSNNYRMKRATRFRLLVEPESLPKCLQQEDTCLPAEDTKERRVALRMARTGVYPVESEGSPTGKGRTYPESTVLHPVSVATSGAPPARKHVHSPVSLVRRWAGYGLPLTPAGTEALVEGGYLEVGVDKYGQRTEKLTVKGERLLRRGGG
jgi:hypothetical protein